MLPTTGTERRRQQGYIMPLAIIMLTAGVLLLTPVLTLMSAALQGQRDQREQIMARLAAEAGVNRVMADLIRGADGIATTYTAEEPHTGGSFQTFTFNTTYTAPTVTVNDYSPNIVIATPTASELPASQQNYIDPGVAHPQFKTLGPGKAYLIRLYNVQPGTLQVNWAYSPASSSRIAVWQGIPVDSSTGLPFPPGLLNNAPKVNPTLDSSSTPSSATFIRSVAITVDTAGIYTIVFDNKSATTTKTTANFAASGGPSDTWIYAKAYRDYVITSTVSSPQAVVKAYVRQVPGYTEPPTGTWTTTNPGFIPSNVYVYSWVIP